MNLELEIVNFDDIISAFADIGITCGVGGSGCKCGCGGNACGYCGGGGAAAPPAN